MSENPRPGPSVILRHPTEDAPLGQLLQARGLVTEAQIDGALARQAKEGGYLGRILIDMGVLSEASLVAELASRLGIEFVDLGDYQVDPTAASRIPEALARRYCALPIAWDGPVLVVAVADPANVLAVDDVRSAARAPVKVVVSTQDAIEGAINRFMRAESDVDDITSFGSSDEVEEQGDLSSLTEAIDDAPIVKLANLLIRQAIQDRASDIHVEPTERDVRIRYRVDGVLHEVMRPPKGVQAGLTSRFKIMAELNIAEKRIPQDGRLSANVGGKQVDLRVATLPTVYGEKIVMRVLDKSTALLDLADLGFLPTSMKRYEDVMTLPWGTILVTGPTGSGKSTTLYSTLNQINDAGRNIITIEDPVEYRLAGINQVQVNPKAGLSFASALRSILRSDPDVVLVGEIRDRETAMIAMEAALTGHLVLSTLHTNDAASTPSRLIEMGLEPYLISSAVSCIVAQRLVRRLCERCREPYEITDAEMEVLSREGPIERPEFVYRSRGCTQCSKTGYRGRFAIHEVLIVSEALRMLVADRAHGDEIKRLSIDEGMITLRQAGVHNVLVGKTSVEELLRVVA
jgi:type IV pilus assembly protein PilB